MILDDLTLAMVSRFSFIVCFFLGDTLKARFAWKKGMGTAVVGFLLVCGLMMSVKRSNKAATSASCHATKRTLSGFRVYFHKQVGH